MYLQEKDVALEHEGDGGISLTLGWTLAFLACYGGGLREHPYVPPALSLRHSTSKDRLDARRQVC